MAGSDEANQAKDNRRRHERLSFDRIQYVGPFLGEEIPSHDQFRAVQCHDISSGGFSFFAPEMPREEFLVVRLGTDDSDYIYVACEIRFLGRQRRAESVEYLVGCRF